MEDPQPSGQPGAVRERGGGLITAAAYVFLLVLGLVLGLFGSFLVPAAPAVFARRLSYALPFVAVTNPVAVALARRLVPQRLGAAVPLLAWLFVVLVLGTSRPEGDIVVPGDFRGATFLVVGAVAGGLALSSRSARPRQPRPMGRGSGVGTRRRTVRATPEE